MLQRQREIKENNLRLAPEASGSAALPATIPLQKNTQDMSFQAFSDGAAKYDITDRELVPSIIHRTDKTRTLSRTGSGQLDASEKYSCHRSNKRCKGHVLC